MEFVRCLLESGREEVGKEWPLGVSRMEMLSNCYKLQISISSRVTVADKDAKEWYAEEIAVGLEINFPVHP